MLVCADGGGRGGRTWFREYECADHPRWGYHVSGGAGQPSTATHTVDGLVVFQRQAPQDEGRPPADIKRRCLLLVAAALNDEPIDA